MVNHSSGNNPWTFHSTQYTTSGHSTSSTEYPKMSATSSSGFVDNNGYGHSTGFYDWGKHINTNESNRPWFTLNATQWNYLLNTRPVSYARYALVKVNNNTGLMLFPDEFLWPDNTIPEPSSSSYSSRQDGYTISEWTALEAAGCVFLRANGYLTHTGNPRVENDEAGFYWTSDYSAGQTQTTTYLHFTSTNVTTTGNDQEHEGVGMNVRIVHIAD